MMWFYFPMADGGMILVHGPTAGIRCKSEYNTIGDVIVVLAEEQLCKENLLFLHKTKTCKENRFFFTYIADM